MITFLVVLSLFRPQKMAQANFNDVLMEKVSGTEPEDDADAFVKQVEHKIKVTLGQFPAPGNDREN